ncbi:MAG: hypothetical protein HQL05_12190 [Nitrospirae bacterium]|uniref:hypothetical protein n=1 Tax=Candidatus Magnetobacterium casense TaxID=1455061 RepID=UPI000A52C2CC|nr:hypothetical protein [Candidatus Magnetobacterium casensis]MBF0338576.1 hypothetical protein [Nitrospirota bacterium]
MTLLVLGVVFAYGVARGADTAVPAASTLTVNASEFKVFDNIGFSTSFVRDGSAGVSGGWPHYHRYSLIEDGNGNLYFTYGNDKQLRYAEYTAASNTWSDSLIDTRQKSVQSTSTVVDSAGNKWASTNDYDRTAWYTGADDASIYKKTGATWNKATDLYTNRGEEASGPADIAQTMIRDANNNLHVLSQRYGWWSYGGATKEMIYNTATSTLGSLLTISGRVSSHPDTGRNDAYFQQILSINGDIYVPMRDGQIFDFTNNSETYIKWKVNGGGTYMGHGVTLADSIGQGGTTAWSYMGSTVFSVDTWYYTRAKVNSDKTATFVTSTGNYDTMGGTVFKTDSFTLNTLQWNLLKKGFIHGGVGDNYGGASVYIAFAEVKTTATPVTVTPQGNTLYNFENAGIPSEFTQTGNWSIDSTTGYSSSNSLYTNRSGSFSLDVTDPAIVSFKIKTSRRPVFLSYR